LAQDTTTNTESPLPIPVFTPVSPMVVTFLVMRR